MGSNDADTDEVLTDDKPFSPMYPVFNFAPDTQVPVQDSRLRPPAYSSAPSPHYNSQEKGGF